MAVPSHGLREVFQTLVPVLEPGCLILSAAKGIEEGSRMTMVQVMEEEAARGRREQEMRFGVISGPSFAAEVVQRQPTAVTVACADHQDAVQAQALFTRSFFRAYTSSDVVGIEICGAMKNVIAIAAGISDGLGYGLNTRAALITRGLAEITRLGMAMGADPLTWRAWAGSATWSSPAPET